MDEEGMQSLINMQGSRLNFNWSDNKVKTKKIDMVVLK